LRFSGNIPVFIDRLQIYARGLTNAQICGHVARQLAFKQFVPK